MEESKKFKVECSECSSCNHCEMCKFIEEYKKNIEDAMKFPTPDFVVSKILCKYYVFRPTYR